MLDCAGQWGFAVSDLGHLVVCNLDPDESHALIPVDGEAQNTVAISPKELYVAAGDDGNCLYIWRYDDLRRMAEGKKPKRESRRFVGDAPIDCAIFSDESTVVVGGRDGAVHVLRAY